MPDSIVGKNSDLSVSPASSVSPVSSVNGALPLNATAPELKSSALPQAAQAEPTAQTATTTQAELGAQSEPGTPACALAEAVAQARSDARKRQKLQRQAHATSGVAAHFYPAPAGREDVALLSESKRELISSFYPFAGRQVTAIRKELCTISPIVQRQEDGSELVIKPKSATVDERLALGAALMFMKTSQRSALVDRSYDYIATQSGISRELHVSTRALLDDIGPRHLCAWAREDALEVFKVAEAEAQNAWADPAASALLVLAKTLPDKLTVSFVNTVIQALSERRKLLPEVLRPLIDDIIKILRLMQPTKIPEFIERVLGWLQLSSRKLLTELKAVGRQLPDNFAFVPFLLPSAYEQAGADLHKLLLTFQIVPKAAKPKPKAKTKTKSAAATGTTRQARPAEPTAPIPPNTSHPVAPSATAPGAASTAPAAAPDGASAPSVPASERAAAVAATSAAASAQSVMTPKDAVGAAASAGEPTPLEATAEGTVSTRAAESAAGSQAQASAGPELESGSADDGSGESGLAEAGDVAADEADGRELDPRLFDPKLHAAIRAKRVQLEHKLKQRKADHKRERKQRKAQRRRK